MYKWNNNKKLMYKKVLTLEKVILSKSNKNKRKFYKKLNNAIILNILKVLKILLCLKKMKLIINIINYLNGTAQLINQILYNFHLKVLNINHTLNFHNKIKTSLKFKINNLTVIII